MFFFQDHSAMALSLIQWYCFFFSAFLYITCGANMVSIEFFDRHRRQYDPKRLIRPPERVSTISISIETNCSNMLSHVIADQMKEFTMKWELLLNFYLSLSQDTKENPFITLTPHKDGGDSSTPELVLLLLVLSRGIFEFATYLLILFHYLLGRLQCQKEMI